MNMNFQKIKLHATKAFGTFMQYMPTKTQVLLFVVWVWTYTLFKLNIFANFVLGLIITYVPDHCIPIVKKIPLKIIKAIDIKGNDVSNKITLFMSIKWNKLMFDTTGGIDLDPFLDYINSNVIWIVYVLDADIDNTKCLRFINVINQETSKSDYTANSRDFVTDNIRVIIINREEKATYKLSQSINQTQRDDILFGEINFY